MKIENAVENLVNIVGSIDRDVDFLLAKIAILKVHAEEIMRLNNIIEKLDNKLLEVEEKVYRLEKSVK